MESLVRMIFSTLIRGGVYRAMRKMGTVGVVACVLVGIAGYVLTGAMR